MANWNENATLRGAWRRAFSRSPICREVLAAGKRYVPKFNQDGKRAKKDAVEYHCQVCNTWVKASVGGKRNIQVDHIVPVIDVTNISGEVSDWNMYKSRLFCDKKNLQRICKTCHDKKTKAERNARNTIKYNGELDQLEKRYKGQELKKLIAKYTTKTRPEEIRKRALLLREKLSKFV